MVIDFVLSFYGEYVKHNSKEMQSVSYFAENLKIFYQHDVTAQTVVFASRIWFEF